MLPGMVPAGGSRFEAQPLHNSDIQYITDHVIVEGNV